MTVLPESTSNRITCPPEALRRREVTKLTVPLLEIINFYSESIESTSATRHSSVCSALLGRPSTALKKFFNSEADVPCNLPKQGGEMSRPA